MRVLVSAQVVAIQLASYARGKAKLMLITQQFSLKQRCDKSTYTAGRTTMIKQFSCFGTFKFFWKVEFPGIHSAYLRIIKCYAFAVNFSLPGNDSRYQTGSAITRRPIAAES